MRVNELMVWVCSRHSGEINQSHQRRHEFNHQLSLESKKKNKQKTFMKWRSLLAITSTSIITQPLKRSTYLGHHPPTSTGTDFPKSHSPFGNQTSSSRSYNLPLPSRSGTPKLMVSSSSCGRQSCVGIEGFTNTSCSSGGWMTILGTVILVLGRGTDRSQSCNFCLRLT